jgi:hypothetical protein
MDGTLTHQRSDALAWDITASAKAEAAETISSVEVLVNGISEYSETFSRPTKQWQRTLTQKGQYPGDNTSQLIVTDDSGNETDFYDEWS